MTLITGAHARPGSASSNVSSAPARPDNQFRSCTPAKNLSLILTDREILVTQSRDKLAAVAPELAADIGIACSSVTATATCAAVTIASRTDQPGPVEPVVGVDSATDGHPRDQPDRPVRGLAANCLQPEHAAGGAATPAQRYHGPGKPRAPLDQMTKSPRWSRGGTSPRWPAATSAGLKDLAQ